MSSKIIAGTTAGTALNMSADTSGQLEIQTGSTPTTAVTIDASQNVGIGTGTAVEKLTVSASGITSGINLTNTGTSGRSYSIFSTSSGAATVGSLGFYDATAAAYRMVIDSSGNLLVGITSTSSFPYTGTIFIGDRGVVDPIQIYRNTTSGAGQIGFNNPNGRVGEIYTSASSTTYATSSDYRLKENIAPMTGALNRISLLKPVTYSWKVDGAHGEGFIAHELAEVVPDCVTGEKDAVDEEGNPVYQGVDTSFLVATLTAAIKELKAELDATKAEIEALKAK